MHHIKYILLAVCSSLLWSIQAQQKLSLSQAIERGLENNYNMRISRNDQNIASINNNWGNTSALPSIQFSLIGRENYNMNDMENYRTETLTPELNLNWTVFNGFSARINKQKFEELEKQSEGNTVILVESTIQDIISAYNNCLVQKELTDVYKQIMQLSEDRYNRSVNSKNLGASTTYENLQAKNAWLEDKSDYLQQRVNYENAVRSLNFLLAEDNATLWEFTSELHADVRNFKLSDLAQKMEGNNKTLRNQYTYQRILAKETALAKSTFLPTLSLNAGVSNSTYNQYYNENTSDISNNSSDTYVGATLQYSIFTAGLRQRAVSIAKINEENAQIQIEQIKHSLNNQLLQMISTYDVQKELLDLAEEKKEAAELNLKLSGEKLKNGSINSFNYRDVQSLYLNAALSHLNAISQLINSNTDILRITGSIIDEY